MLEIHMKSFRHGDFIKVSVKLFSKFFGSAIKLETGENGFEN